MTTQLDTREALFEVMAQITAEREAARPLVEELLSREEPPWDKEIPEQWKTAGFVDELTTGAAGMLEKDPTRSLGYLQFALAVATSIPPDRYPSELNAHLANEGWREIAFAHRYQGAYPEALRALDAAQGSLEFEPALSYEGTITKYSRAGVHAHTRRLDEALRLLDDCERESRALGDTRRSLRCELVRANICVWRGNLEGAYTRFKELLEPISKNDDLQTRGIVYNNFGQTCVRQGKFAEAKEALGTAREIYVKLEMPGEIDRVDWGLAAILLATGEFERALSSLRRIREAFLKREMVEDAGLVGLDIVDALVAIDHWTEARELSEQVLAEFRHSNLDDRAVRAMAYLREFSTVSQRARAAVRHVRSYIEELREHPDEVFLPLPDVE